jgi:hypothetical protein
MPPRSQRLTTGRGWTNTHGQGMSHPEAEGAFYLGSDTRTAGERDGIAAGWPGTSPRYLHHKPVREALKPILDELRTKIEDLGEEATRDDWQWLRGQLRKLAACLEP